MVEPTRKQPVCGKWVRKANSIRYVKERSEPNEETARILPNTSSERRRDRRWGPLS